MTTRSGGAVERLARLETQMDGVKTALDRGSASFEKFDAKLDEHAAETRKQINELKGMVAGGVSHGDLKSLSDRIAPLETFRDRVKRYGGIGSAIGAGIIFLLTVFGPSRVAEAWEKLWG